MTRSILQWCKRWMMQGAQIKEEILAAGFKVKQEAVEMGITDIYLYKILRSTNVSEKQVLKIRNAIAKLLESAEPHIRTDCAFLKLKKGEREKHSCIALTELVCKKEICPFFKTFEQERDELYKTGMNRKGRLRK